MTVWQRFRTWRRSRPFWGGLLSVLAGLEIVGSMNLELHGGTISFGPEKFTGYLIAFTLVICGVLAWFTPAQRHFYGLVATFVAIYSLLGVNLGGFFIGMLLGIAGGGLIFAWNPATPADDSSDVDDALPRHAVAIIAVLALSFSMLTAVGPAAPAVAAGPCPTVSPSPSPSPSPSNDGGIIGDFFDWLGRLIRGGPKPTPTPTPTPTTTPSPCPAPSVPGTPGSPGVPGVPGTPGAPGAPVKLLKPMAGQPNVGKRPSRMTGTRVTMFNLVFDGVVDLPTVDGPIRVLRFSMAQSDTNDFLLHVYGDQGWDTDLKSSKLTVKGGTVHFYTSRFRGNLFGLLPVDYTPTNLPPPIPLPLVFFTNPDVQLVWVNAPTLEAPRLRISLVRA